MIIKHEKVKEQIILVRPFAECILLQMFEGDPFLGTAGAQVDITVDPSIPSHPSELQHKAPIAVYSTADNPSSQNRIVCSCIAHSIKVSLPLQ